MQKEEKSWTVVRLVTRHKPLLVQYIDLPSLWPYLSSRNLLTSDEYLCLTNKWREGHRQDSVGELLAILQRKHPLWAIGLYEALEESTQQSADVHSGHEHIVQVLQKEMKEGAPRCAVATPDTLAQDKYHSPGSDCGCSLCSWKIIKDLRSENDALRQRYSSMQTEIAKLVVAYLLLCYLT